MPGLPYAAASYKIVDADQHVTEPLDLWSRRVPKHLQDKAPQPVKLPNGTDAWSFDGGKSVRPLTSNTNSAGLAAHQVTPDAVVSFDTIRPSNFDPQARLKDMTLDGIYAAVIYSTVGLGGGNALASDAEVQKACVRAYNDWLAEDFCAADPKRLYGAALQPCTGVADLLAEIEHARKKGLKGIILTRWPNGGQGPTPEDDNFWRYAEETNLPVCVHFGPAFGPTVVTSEPMGPNQIALGTNSKAGVTGIPVLDALLGQCIAERFPRVKIALVESNIGWIPCYLEQADDRWLHFRWYTGKSHLEMTPSQQWRRNYWASFMMDRIGVELRHYIGVDRIMWSSDFPHGGHEWPNSRNLIDRLFRGIPDDEVKLILHDNAATFYGLSI